MSSQSTILLVDDSPDHLMVLGDLLESAGYHVLSAEDGTSGIQRAGHAKPNLILMDVRMPGWDGYETCQYLKTQADLREIPVMLMSSHRDDEGIEEAVAAGGVDFVRKPFRRQEVLKKVQTHLALQEISRP